ncbi:zinc-dependent alcohol dehydrogenase family protein (plasmid) [Nicoliella spurrieriana]|uniref:Zinc-dependent alcohol dehydrogenase family protein n=1 Tax=Nicoliella spurrieriana TaxID=2925830 RepID=A0A976X530_9LACO|nr:zinc-dependent alcohol dehydrogenase family protein [Nicoliella spurrieriana]UQS86117.1 zinc-dependent alcohol dehydrogenase family protein [Nicoliella spurrieriana]
MKQTRFVKAGKVEVKDVPKPTIEKPDDVILHVVQACVCGSDLWSYRGLDDKEPNSLNNGHEAIGVVESVGSEITTVQPGDFVIAPFTHGCGHCAACRAGFDGNCQNHDDNFSSGYQSEYVRYQHANWALVKVPGKPEDYSQGMLNSFLTLSDVMATGFHAAKTANVQTGDTAVVIGDGAVGLCGVISAQLLGAKRIIAMSRHADRQAMAKEFGATDVIAERGDDAVAKVMELTNGAGADAVLECVGSDLSTNTALKIARPGAHIGRVGLPHGDVDYSLTFGKNIALSGGIASVTTYDKGRLLKAVLDGQINPGKVFTKSFNIDNVDAAYQAMANRETIKSVVTTE